MVGLRQARRFLGCTEGKFYTGTVYNNIFERFSPQRVVASVDYVNLISIIQRQLELFWLENNAALTKRPFSMRKFSILLKIILIFCQANGADSSPAADLESSFSFHGGEKINGQRPGEGEAKGHIQTTPRYMLLSGQKNPTETSEPFLLFFLPLLKAISVFLGNSTAVHFPLPSATHHHA